jgi:hypothetical protein
MSVFFGLAPLQTCSLTIWKADLKSSSQTFVTSALETSWRKPKFILVLVVLQQAVPFRRHFLGLYG